MSNRISEIVDEIQYRQKLTHEQIANKIGYSRPYFTDALKKGTSKKLIIALEKSFPEIVQNVLSEDAPTFQQKRLQSKLNGSREDVPVYNGSTTLGHTTEATTRAYVLPLANDGISKKVSEFYSKIKR